MEEGQRHDIGLMLYDDVPTGFDEEFAREIGRRDIRFGVARIPGGPFAGVEVYLPAVVGIFIASSYFSGFLKKAGEDHYTALKGAAKRLWKRSSALRVRAFGSEGKLPRQPVFSLAYAITGEVAPRLNFKLVLRLDAGETEAGDAIDAFLDMLRSLHFGQLSEEDLAAVMSHEPVGGIVVVTFDPKERRLLPVQPFKR